MHGIMVREFDVKPGVPRGRSSAEERSAGNDFFKKGDWENAIDRYGNAIDLATDPKKELLPALSNRAMASLKQSSWKQALADCDAALKIDPRHAKALFRRGSAYRGLDMCGRPPAGPHCPHTQTPDRTTERARGAAQQSERSPLVRVAPVLAQSHGPDHAVTVATWAMWGRVPCAVWMAGTTRRSATSRWSSR